jgi:hypothetical protein
MPNYKGPGQWANHTSFGGATANHWGVLKQKFADNAVPEGMDRWGGSELSGHEKNVKVFQNDYKHQVSEQPSAPSSPKMTPINKLPKSGGGLSAGLGGGKGRGPFGGASDSVFG